MHFAILLIRETFLGKMALLSKFLEDFGTATGIPAIAISRTLYSAAILGYIYNVAFPEWQKSRKNTKQIIVPGGKKIRREDWTPGRRE